MQRHHLSIQLARGSDGLFYLSISDPANNVEVLSSKLTAEALADLLSTRPTSVLAKVNASRIGTKIEHKVVWIKRTTEMFAFPTETRESARAAMVKEHEVDGWLADLDDFDNNHKYANGMTAVTFTRYVPKG